MSINRLKVVLEQPEYSALLKLAIAELRNPQDEIRFIVRLELIRRGLLSSDFAKPIPDKSNDAT